MSNEAAERLRNDLGGDTGILARIRITNLDVALATERRNTVKRIGDRITALTEETLSPPTLAEIRAILDEPGEQRP